jgi:hypothetical protein
MVSKWRLDRLSDLGWHRLQPVLGPPKRPGTPRKTIRLGTDKSACPCCGQNRLHAQAKAYTTRSSFLCEPRRIVGQAILPAAGFRAGSALDARSRPAGWKAGCSQDWLPHLAAKPHCATRVQKSEPVYFTIVTFVGSTS